MKRTSPKFRGAAVVCVLGLLMGCIQGFAQVFPNQATTAWNQLAFSLQTPEAIVRYMWRHFSYENDRTYLGREDYWQFPEELLTSQRGDCEDFSLFAYELLKKNGIPSFLLSLYSRGYGHTVCVFKENGLYHAIDGVRVTHHGTGTLEELFTEIYPFWKNAAIVSPSPATRQAQILRKFQRVS